MIQSGWTGSLVSLCHLSPPSTALGGRVHLSPFVSLHLSPSLDAWRGSGSFVSLCLPSFVSRCLPAWMPGWTDSLVSLCLPSFVVRCLPAWIWHGDGFMCLPLSPSFASRSLPAWMPGTALWVDGFICLPLSPLISPVVSQPGCLARLSGWTGSFVSLCLPSFVSRCLPAWMPGAGLWVGSFVYLCLPGCLAPLCFPSFVSRCVPAWMPGTVFLVDRFTFLPLSPFIWLLLSPSLDVCHGSPGGRIHLSRLGSPSFVSHLCGWTDSFVSLCLPLFVSRCLPAWMPGTALWVDGFICLPLSPSLDVWHSRSAVSFTSRGSVLLAGSGLPSALALASVIPCLVDVGDRVLLCLPFIWTSISLGLVVGRLPCLSLATPCLFVQCLVISCGPELTIAVRCGARLQLREGSVNPPVKQT